MSVYTISRRSVISSFAGGAIAGSIAQGASASSSVKLKGRIKQSVCAWCYGDLAKDFDKFARECAEMGLVGIDLASDPKQWEILKKYNLVSTMVSGGGGISRGLNDKANHKNCMEQFKKNIPAAAKAGWPNVITFSGNRRGMEDEKAWDNCALILKEAVKIAEDEGVTICMELLNSKVDHKDYHCDHTDWGVEVCKRVDSPRCKLLYDIYHMQIMEGDIIRTIKKNIDHIGHFHTGGNPGRNDIDESQELYYPAIMETIAELTDQGKFNGYTAQEFVPKNGMKSLQNAVRICDV